MPGTPRGPSSPVDPSIEGHDSRCGSGAGDGGGGGDGPPSFTSPRALLEYLYADLTRFSEVAADHVVLHPADRAVSPGGGSGPPLVGVEACQQHEEGLVSGGRVKMRVEEVVANQRFGCVLGVMEMYKAEDEEEEEGEGEKKGGPRGCTEEGPWVKLEANFCGVWRFEWAGGKVKAVEHWENLDGEGEVRRVMGVMRRST
ncbi:hypothetical protein QBC42DRAFT_323446 [Cladorrhinum samala]|uniref:Uncharacterized protein n=1 Tax=Cladorrhinum samala TaxID=585594 RepID=A0AAV9I4F0_9PEZI|nr:hypothetical protein QBC42DRAFT_323446 [Cladorrhinum samala]